MTVDSGPFGIDRTFVNLDIRIHGRSWTGTPFKIAEFWFEFLFAHWRIVSVTVMFNLLPWIEQLIQCCEGIRGLPATKTCRSGNSSNSIQLRIPVMRVMKIKRASIFRKRTLSLDALKQTKNSRSLLGMLMRYEKLLLPVFLISELLNVPSHSNNFGRGQFECNYTFRGINL